MLLKKSKGNSKKFLETNDNENMTTQNLWDAAKEGSLQQYNPTSRNKENIEQTTNFTPKTTGKRRTTKKSPKLVEGKKS